MAEPVASKYPAGSGFHGGTADDVGRRVVALQEVDKIAWPHTGSPPALRGCVGRPPAVAARTGYSFSLGTLLLILTLASICFAIVAAMPAMAIPLIVLIPPAALRTIAAADMARRCSAPFTLADKLTTFVWSLSLIGYVLFTTSGTCLLVSLVIFVTVGVHIGMALALLANALAALASLSWAFLWITGTWPRTGSLARRHPGMRDGRQACRQAAGAWCTMRFGKKHQASGGRCLCLPGTKAAFAGWENAGVVDGGGS